MKIGDPVEVKFVSYDSKRGRHMVDHWVPATVCSVSVDRIGVAFANGDRMMVERGRHHFRRAKSAENLG